MLNYQHNYLEMKDICLKHMFWSYYQPNCLLDIYRNILLCLKLQKVLVFMDIDLHSISLNNLHNNLQGIGCDIFSIHYQHTLIHLLDIFLHIFWSLDHDKYDILQDIKSCINYLSFMHIWGDFQSDIKICKSLYLLVQYVHKYIEDRQQYKI